MADLIAATAASAAPRRVLAVALPRFSTDRLRRRSLTPLSPDRPLVLVSTTAGRQVITAVDDIAASLGLAPGQSLGDARARVPEVQARDADPAADRRALDDLADWAGRYTPWAAAEPEITDGGAGLLLDLTGTAHLFGGEAAVIADARRRLARLGYQGRMAVASSPGAAWALARFDERAAPGLVLASGEERAAVLALPVAALRIGAAAAELQHFGLQRVADIAERPRAPVAERFGALVVRRLEQILGAPEPIQPRRPVPRHRTRLTLPEPVATAEQIAALVDRLLAALVTQLGHAGVGARKLELEVFRVDGAVRRLSIGTHRASRDIAHLARLFRRDLDKLDPGHGVDVVALSAPEVEPLAPEQLPLGTAPMPAAAPLPLLDRLTQRLGRHRVGRLVARESHVPERAQRLAPIDAEATPVASSPAHPRVASSSAHPRPVRLLPRPEPIEAMALLPDEPPRWFRWRGVRLAVARADGPERIAPEWWRGDANTRDYYRVEDEQGHRYWLYRDGLYGQTPDPRWYLHGLFA
ncbi:MAG: DNA polymerase Y family protein [Alphaproteobacteria bacterium]|nr:MAG: DNA polymerase Y family protein [Alphaproteobacteria bacterium]